MKVYVTPLEEYPECVMDEAMYHTNSLLEVYNDLDIASQEQANSFTSSPLNVPNITTNMIDNYNQIDIMLS